LLGDAGEKVQPGDCFVVTRPQPYVKSLAAWKAGG
jgi:hypothetical protein